MRAAERTLTQGEKNCSAGEYDLACFLAEQSAQKALKAVRYADGARFVTVHSIAELVKQVSELHPEFLELRERAVQLDQYYLSSRYPDAVAEPAIPSDIFVQKQADEALRIAEKIFAAAKKIINA